MAGGRKSDLPVIGERAETVWLLPVFLCHEMDLFLCSVRWFGSITGIRSARFVTEFAIF